MKIAVSGVIFLLAAGVLLSRLLLNWELVVDGWPVPLWFSAVAFVIAAALAYEGFRLSKS